MKIQAKQINKLLAGFISTNPTQSTITNNTSSLTVSSSLMTTWLSAAGFNAGVVTNKRSSGETDDGLIAADTDNNYVLIDKTNKTKIFKGTQVVFGRLTWVTDHYVISFYYLDESGTPAAYTADNNYLVEFKIPYRFQLKDLPTDIYLKLKQWYLNDGSEGGGGGTGVIDEWLDTVAAIKALTAHDDKADVGCYANGKIYQFDINSMLSDDSPTTQDVLKPDDISSGNPGRWIRKAIIPVLVNALPLGHAPDRTDYTDGFFQWLNSENTANAIWDLNSILVKLIPPKPADLSTFTPVMTLYQAKRSSPHTSVVIVDDCTDVLRPVGTVTNVYDPLSGNLEAVIDSISSGSLDLSTVVPPASDGALSITDVHDPFAGQVGKENFWEVFIATVASTVDLALGNHTYAFNIGSDYSHNKSFWEDDPGVVNIINVLHSLPAHNTRHVSGVPSLAVNDLITLTTLTVNNAVRWHYNKDKLAIFSCPEGTAAGSPAGWLPPQDSVNPLTQGSIQIYTNKTIAMLTNKYNENVLVSIVGYNSKDVAGTPYSEATSSRIDTVSDESTRKISNSGDWPASGYGEVYDSTVSLKTGGYVNELQMLDGQYQCPTGNYLSNLPDNGPNYNTGIGSNDRWVTFQPILLNNNLAFTLNLINSLNFGSNIIIPGTKIFAKVEGATGWVDCNLSYQGVGNPSVDGDPALVYGSSTVTSRRITFGSAVKTGLLYIRIGLPAGSTKKFGGIIITNIV